MDKKELEDMINNLWELEDRALLLAHDIKKVMRKLLRLHTEFQEAEG